MRKQYNFWPWPTEEGTNAWDVDRLIELSRGLPVKTVPLNTIWQVDSLHWGPGLTPREVALHVRLINEADMSFPIILAVDGRVMDGMHRVLKGLLAGDATIAAVQFEVQPEPDFRDCRPEDLSDEETSN